MFNKIIVLKLPHIPEATLREIQINCKSPLVILNETGSRFLELAVDAEVILTHFLVSFSEKFLRSCSNLRYIGVYGSTLKNVDLRAAAEMNIQVRNVSNYCDGETVELLLTEVLMMARNIGPISWKEKPTSLFGKRLGIIGMGGTGHALARLASGIGMNVSYFSPTRSTVADQAGYRYMSKADLLGQSDIISLHVPPFVPALGADDFKLITSGSILMSSCQGRVWDRDRLMGWLADSANRLILDGFAFSQLPATDQEELRLCSQVRISPVWAYLTTESLQRIADLFLAQFLDFGKQCTASV